jgi:hypothetical protein
MTPALPLRRFHQTGTILESFGNQAYSMPNRSFAFPALFLAVCLLPVLAPAQSLPAPKGAASKPANTSQAATKANDELLAKAGKLYYSTAKAGLDGFACSVHPDWRALFLSANKDSPVAADDPRLVQLNSVKIALHAHLKGSSTLDWTPPANPDEDSSKLLDNMHQATEQTLQGFLQFWTPFVDGSAVPSNAEGLEVTPTGNGYRLHAKQDGTEVTELMDSNLVLRHFDVSMSNSTVKFAPTYQATEKGLLVEGFLAHILAAGAPPEQEQEMHVTILYQTLDGFPIPAKLFMEVVNTGVFNFTLDGCTVDRQPAR